MQNDVTSVGAEKARVGIVGKTIFILLFLVLAVTIAHYKGFMAGIGSGIVFSFWLHRNIFRYQLKTKADVLYEQELKIQRESFKPYIPYIGWFLLVIVGGGGALYVVTREAGTFIIFVTIVSIVFLLFFYLLKGRLSSQDIVTTMNQMGFMRASVVDISSIHERIQSLGKNIGMGNLFSGSVDGFSARIFDFSYEWAGDAGYNMTLLEVTNTRKCPNMLIISKSDTFCETISLNNIFPGVPVQLEGNFSEHFSLFVEDGAEDTIRQFLPPDLMAVLIDKMPDFSFMFFDDKLYIVISNNTEHGFLRDYFVEQVGKARFILGKWALTLSKVEE